MAPTLRPYQDAAGRALEEAFFDKGQNRLLIKKPTGTGKTVWFAALLRAFPRLRKWLEQFPPGERKMLVIAHREELLEQAVEKIRAANKGVMVSIEQGSLYSNPHSDVIAASIQTLSAMKFRRLKRLLTRHKFRIVIVDEAHHSAAATYRTALVHLGFLPPADASDREELEAADHDDVAAMAAALETWDLEAPKDRILVGVTATPNRTDAIGLGCVFQSIAYTYSLRQAIEDGWLAPIVPWVVDTSTSLDGVRLTRGEFNQTQLATAVNNPERNRLAAHGWRKYADGRPTIAFTVDVAHAHDLTDVFRAEGVNAVAISGETPKADRRQALESYRNGRIDLLANCMLLTEGTDLPLTSCILHAAPTLSGTLYEQKTGRGLRVHPDDPAGPSRLEYLARGGDGLVKPDCVVIDVVDIARRHSLQTAPVLYGLPPGIVASGKELGRTAKDLEALLAKYPRFNLDDALEGKRVSVDELAVQASTFDVWSIPSIGDFGVGLLCNWFRVGNDTYRLEYPWADGMETLKVERNLLGNFDVSLTLRPKMPEGGPYLNARRHPGAHVPIPQVRQRTIGADVPAASQALQLAEAFVLQERRSIMKIRDREAPWRERPASEKQKALLRRFRVPHSPTIKCGDASDLITLAQSRGGK